MSRLPVEDFARLAPGLKKVTLIKGEILYPAGGNIELVYFPSTALVSLSAASIHGHTVEVGMTGFEGCVGVPVLWQAKQSPFQTTTQITGQAWQVNAEMLLAEAGRCGSLQKLLLGYTNLLCTQVAQSAMCNRFHTPEERLCRWLLAGQDRQQTDTLELTQELISSLLGSNRSTVTITARMLQAAGLIRYKRGIITLLDRPGLEELACECYGIVKREFTRFLNS
ncbi:MAG TPA: Crp/Fnr family transcriptional regulator [Blastocatellia bacterium]|nr:Crp/Fnr family transcriptional regulator [Blastocatellia bacterium]